MGPLGNGWSAAKRSSGPKRLALVAGGVGSAPFYLLVKELMANPESERPETTYVFGARSERRLNSVDDFQKLGVDVKVVTEDGSVGVKGLVTDVLPEIFPKTLDPQDAQVLACARSLCFAVAKWCAAQGTNAGRPSKRRWRAGWEFVFRASSIGRRTTERGTTSARASTVLFLTRRGSNGIEFCELLRRRYEENAALLLHAVILLKEFHHGRTSPRRLKEAGFHLS